MATLTPQDIQQLIEAAVKGTIEGQQKVRRDGGSSLDERYFWRVDEFDGKEDTWKEWSFQFKTQVVAASKVATDRLDDIQRAGADPDWESLFIDAKDEVVDKLEA